jgi:hypothetical protein
MTAERGFSLLLSFQTDRGGQPLYCSICKEASCLVFKVAQSVKLARRLPLILILHLLLFRRVNMKLFIK